MSNVIVTPNMGLTLPMPGVELGPQYASDNNGAFTTLDGHNHAAGSGVQINPAGININADLPINSHNLTLVNSTEYVNLSSPLTGASPYLNTVYAASGNLYFNDGSGNQVKITSAGAVNATSSGITSGTATAAFSGGVLVVNSNTNTPANIQAGSILIGNNVASSKYVTLQAPSSLGANYSLTLPPTNSTGNTAFVTIDTSNNMNEGPSTVGGITSSNIASATILGSNIAANTITRANEAAVGQQISSSCGNVTRSYGPAYQSVTNLSVSLTTSGRPAILTLQSSGLSGTYYQFNGAAQNIIFAFFRGSTQLSEDALNIINVPSPYTTTLFPLNLHYVDVVAAGTYTYTFQVLVGNNNGVSLTLNEFVLAAYEL